MDLSAFKITCLLLFKGSGTARVSENGLVLYADEHHLDSLW